tara:strand:- start:132 stop:539 length:408 start_codon:yes stop_codon:yes gene_type:complete
LFKKKDNLRYFVLQVLFPLLIGLLIYIFREKIPSDLEFLLVKNNSIRLPEIILFHLSDALWAYSLTSMLVLIRINDIIRYRVLSVLMSIFIMVFFEFSQLINICPGTFDILDIFFMFVSVLIFIIINLQLLTKKI